MVQFAVSVHRAAEDYLEAMLMMKETHGYIRSIDVAEHLGVTKPSVTYATKQLKQNGFITMDRDGLITLAFTVELDDLDGVADFCVFQRFHIPLSLNHDFARHFFTDGHA